MLSDLLSWVFGTVQDDRVGDEPRDRIGVAFAEATKRFRRDPHFAHQIARDGRREYAWVVQERLAVHYAVNLERTRLGLPIVQERTIRDIEDTCLGHSDYADKLALRCAELCVKDGTDDPTRRP